MCTKQKEMTKIQEVFLNFPYAVLTSVGQSYIKK